MTAVYGAMVDFHHPRLIDYQFKAEIEKFEFLSTGQETAIPINPYGWEMELTKH